MSQSYGLGRGLASLIPQKDQKISEPKKDFNYFGATPVAGLPNAPIEPGNGAQEVDIMRIVPNPHQPRVNFNAEKLQELCDSIKEHGVLQPLIVSKNDGQYELIAGERRLQASKLAGLKKVPVVIRDVTDQQKLELAIIENVQRHDLDPIEEAKSYLKLSQEFDLHQEEVARKVGKSRSVVANKLRLLSLPVEIQRALVERKITEGHAKAILALENPEKQRALFEMIVKNSLNVRQTESKTREISVKNHTRAINVDPEVKKVEDDLSAKLGTRVKFSQAGTGGKIIIEYYSKEELENLISKLC